MPHLVIEYSSNVAAAVKSANIVELLHHAVMQCGLFKPEDVKTRAYQADDFYVGEKGNDGSFLHVFLHIKQGRTLEQRQALTKTVADMVRTHIANIDQITVDISELSDAYCKSVKT